jgi:hypothetical protein
MPRNGKIVGLHDGRTGTQFHSECAPKIPKRDKYPIRFGDPDFGYGSVPVCQKCGKEITTVP